MSVYAIDAVRMNAKSGLVEQVRWGKVDHTYKHWEVEPVISDVTDVVEKILSGEEVRAAFPVGHFTVLGPKVGITISSQGKDIEVIDPDDHPGRTVAELPTF
ncbi:MAG: hypothetical protein JWQ23_3032 [Herminiimonas sp.]|nr:hypothetical protein [Herminiimonas sp.]